MRKKKATVTNDNVAVVHDLIRTYVASHSVCFTSTLLASYRSVLWPPPCVFSGIPVFGFKDVLLERVTVRVCDPDPKRLGNIASHGKDVELGTQVPFYFVAHLASWILGFRRPGCRTQAQVCYAPGFTRNQDDKKRGHAAPVLICVAIYS